MLRYTAYSVSAWKFYPRKLSRPAAAVWRVTPVGLAWRS